MIDKLNIENFMTFEKLKIPTLKLVNLIGGKNNSGKTTLLDAIRVLYSEGNDSVINNILNNRGSFKKNLVSSYQGLFNRDSKRHKINYSLSINNFFLHKENLNKKDRYYHIQHNSEIELNANIDSDSPRDEIIYVPFKSGLELLNDLWENIVLTSKEDDVNEILRETVEPNLVRFDVGNSVRVRLKGLEQPVPLGTLGDGVYRVLLIALSLANAKDSILLIDEIELGLHYSAMEKLWEMIFKYAHEWNIQIFVTTHSQDAIKTFHYVASNEKYIDDAEYIRLQISRKGENEAIVFDGNRLKDSLDLQLEIR